FFFQAEDGIRDRNVTGVQTCALPILCTSKIWTPLPVLSSALIVMARRVPVFGRSCQAYSETLPKEVSRPVENWRTSMVAPAGASSAAEASAESFLSESFFSGGVRRIASHAPSGLKANDWIPSTVVSSPVARLRRPILLGMGFLSFFSFSSCDSEMPME